MTFEVQRTRDLLQRGAPLARALGGRIGLELRLVVQGGLRILERIDAVNGDVFSSPIGRERCLARDLDASMRACRARALAPRRKRRCGST